MKHEIDGRGMKQRRIHLPQFRSHPQRKLGLTQDVALQVDARRQFDNRNAFRLQAKDATFRDVENFLALSDCSRARKGDLLDRVNELLDPALLQACVTAPSLISSLAPAVK